MTQTMILFLSMVALMSVFLACVVIVPWFTGRTNNDNHLMSVNVAVFEERIAELLADKETGTIDEQTFLAGRIDLERQLLAAKQTAKQYAPASIKSRAIVMIWIPVLALLAYLSVGDRTTVFTLWQGMDSVNQVADDLLTGKIDVPPQWATRDSTALISAMQLNVHRHASDPDRWMRLSELFMAMEATPQALEALARAHRLDPTNDDVALVYAQTGFFAGGGVLDETTRDVLTELLGRRPDHEGAMMLMAMGETRANNFIMAKAWIAKLRSNIAGKSGDRSAALSSLDELLASIEASESKIRAGVTIGVTVSDALLPKVPEGAVLFVSISDVAGGAPYAVKRLPVSVLTQGRVSVNLSDLDAMVTERTLTVAREQGATLAVNARISHDGTAVSRSGDFAANPIVLEAAQNAVNLTISQVVP